MELWHIWACPASMRVRAAVAEKGIPYHGRELLEGERAGNLHHRNPDGTLPMLVHGDEVVVGVVPIVTWLSDRWPEPPLLPRAVGREQVLATCAWVDRLFEGVLPRVAHGMPEERVKALGEARRAMGDVDGVLGNGSFLLPEFSFADLTLASYLACLPRDWRPASLGHERLARWERLVMTRPSVREQMGPRVPAAA
jgi:glutathione S-transferase